MDLELVSTAHLEILATRSEALRTLYRNVDVTADEFFKAKKDLRSVLEGVAGTSPAPKIEVVWETKETVEEEPNGNR